MDLGIMLNNSLTDFSHDDMEELIKCYELSKQQILDNDEDKLNLFISNQMLLSNYYLKFGKTLFRKFCEAGIIKCKF